MIRQFLAPTLLCIMGVASYLEGNSTSGAIYTSAMFICLQLEALLRRDQP